MPVSKDVPEFAWPARFAYAYRWKLIGWLLDGHAFLREKLRSALPRAIRRDLVLTERVVEIPFVLKSVRLPGGSLVLDIGSRWSPLPLFLTAMGYRVVAVDLVPFPIGGHGSEFVLADMRHPPFKAESFDGATVVSTLEHVGLGFYDGVRDSDDDIRLMSKLRSLLKPNGILALTVPYGRPGADTHQRSYDRERLAMVTEGWAQEEIRFAVRRGAAWQPAPEKEAAQELSIPETRAVAMLLLRRRG